MDTSTRCRLSLILVLAILLVCAAAGTGFDGLLDTHSGSRLHGPTDDSPAQSPQDTRAGDAAIVAQLQALIYREPTAAEWKRVSACLDHPSWLVAGTALQVLGAHHHPQLAAAQTRLLERALDEPQRTNRVDEPVPQALVRSATMSEALGQFAHSSDPTVTRLLVRVFQHAPTGPLRARALELLAARPQPDWEQMIRAALADPSQRVRSTAMNIVAERRWIGLVPAIEPIAASPRPALQRRAREVLALLGHPVTQSDDGPAVRRASRELADDLWRAGLEYRDVLPDHEPTARIDPELLARHAEAYLDSPVDRGPAADDFHGVLFLAAAVRAGQEKLVRRIWEREVSRTDTDAELYQRGLEALARGRLLAGLSAYAGGDESNGLHELSSVLRLASSARQNPRLQAYVRQASELSSAIWRTALRDPAGRTRSPGVPDSAAPARMAGSVLGGLDLSDPRHRAEAQRRLDSLCGLSPTAAPTDRHHHPVAN